jgi:putative YphP/YqiW family bacilliredoxin
MYPPQIVMPMKEELTSVGFEDLTTPAQVDEAIKSEGTTLVVINSVCGCAAGNARPGVRMSLDNDKKPNRATTVFAGFDKEAVNAARAHMAPYPPSSPSIALFKNGELVHFIERLSIEGVSAQAIAERLKDAYNEHC